MEIIELQSNNIDRYLDDCIEVQKYLVESNKEIRPKQIQATASAEHNYFIGILEDDRVVGLGVVHKIVHPILTNAYIDNIVVHPDYRGRGLFTVIMDALEAKARQWGVEQTRLTCSREQIQSLYEKRGYKEKDTKYYVLKM